MPLKMPVTLIFARGWGYAAVTEGERVSTPAEAWCKTPGEAFKRFHERRAAEEAAAEAKLAAQRPAQGG